MPMYSYTAINALASNDTGHFVFLSPWQFNACLSITEQASPLYLWMNDQNPLTPPEIDDLQAQLAQTQDQLMSVLVGMIMPIATKTIPQGCLMCDGSIYQRALFPQLYDALEDAFIVDADYFMTPNLVHRFVQGAVAGSGGEAGDTGGSETVTQTVDQMPAHIHTSPPHSHSESAAAPSTVTIGLEVPVPAAIPAASFTGATAVSIDSAGGGQPMDILPPYMRLRYVIVAR